MRVEGTESAAALFVFHIPAGSSGAFAVLDAGLDAIGLLQIAAKLFPQRAADLGADLPKVRLAISSRRSPFGIAFGFFG